LLRLQHLLHVQQQQQQHMSIVLGSQVNVQHNTCQWLTRGLVHAFHMYKCFGAGVLIPGIMALTWQLDAESQMMKVKKLCCTL
jgi:hypothetical protein